MAVTQSRARQATNATAPGRATLRPARVAIQRKRTGPPATTGTRERKQMCAPAGFARAQGLCVRQVTNATAPGRATLRRARVAIPRKRTGPPATMGTRARTEMCAPAGSARAQGLCARRAISATSSGRAIRRLAHAATQPYPTGRPATPGTHAPRMILARVGPAFPAHRWPATQGSSDRSAKCADLALGSKLSFRA